MVQKRKTDSAAGDVAGSLQYNGGQHNGIAWLFCLFAAFLLWIYVMAVLDEEFAAQDAEQDDAGDHVGGEIVQSIGGRDLARATGQEYE